MGEPGGLPSMGSYRVGTNWSDLAAAAADHLYLMWLLIKLDLNLIMLDLTVCFLFVPSLSFFHDLSIFFIGLLFVVICFIFVVASGCFLVAQLVKNLLAIRKTWVGSLGWKDPLEKGTATQSSILVERIPWTGQARRVGHDWILFPFTFQDVSYQYLSYCNVSSSDIIPHPIWYNGEGNGTSLQYSGLENPVDRGAWGAAVYGVAQSRTRLKRLSSSSSSSI